MVISRYTLTGETPSKKNNRIGLRSGKNIPSERYQKWKKAKYSERNQCQSRKERRILRNYFN